MLSGSFIQILFIQNVRDLFYVTLYEQFSKASRNIYYLYKVAQLYLLNQINNKK